MTKSPTIKGSAQARLLLYRLLSAKLADAENKFLIAEPLLWEQILTMLEKLLDSDAQIKSDQAVLAQVFSYIDRTTREGLQKQIERLSGKSLWLGVHST